jgi:hypothetical protein
MQWYNQECWWYVLEINALASAMTAHSRMRRKAVEIIRVE